jgi:hypothetical protein
MHRLTELYDMFDEHNEEDFGGQLRQIRILLKRNEHRDGFYEYKAHQDWTPIRHEAKRSVIILSDGLWEEEQNQEEGEDRPMVQEALVHEMVHMYQAEVLHEAPHHNETFEEWCKYFDTTYGIDIR